MVAGRCCKDIQRDRLCADARGTVRSRQTRRPLQSLRSIMTGDTNKKPDASVYRGGGTHWLRRPMAPSDLPPPGPRPRRDGPISAIDPETMPAMFARQSAELAPTAFAVADTTPDDGLMPLAACRNQRFANSRRQPGASNWRSIRTAAGKVLAKRLPRQRLHGKPGAPDTPNVRPVTEVAAGVKPGETLALLDRLDEAWPRSVTDRDKAVHFTGYNEGRSGSCTARKTAGAEGRLGHVAREYVSNCDGIRLWPETGCLWRAWSAELSTGPSCLHPQEFAEGRTTWPNCAPRSQQGGSDRSANGRAG